MSIGRILLLLLELPLDVVCNIEYALCWCFAHKTLCTFGIVLQGACFAEIVFASCHNRVCKLFPGTPAHVACKWQTIILIFAILFI